MRRPKYRKPKKCPKCKSTEDVILIQYGYPSKRMIEDRECGKIILGGCIVSPENPDWYCKKCDYKWK
jgi:hypothetical protein